LKKQHRIANQRLLSGGRKATPEGNKTLCLAFEAKQFNDMPLPPPPPECKVYTPPRLADAMVHAIEPHPHDVWLDPCMGPGAFIAPLRKKGIPKDRIIGIDIDSTSGAEDKSATTVRGVDFSGGLRRRSKGSPR
jgi:hypothetical protein